MNTIERTVFKETYRRNLVYVRRNFPDYYVWSECLVHDVADRMCAAIDRGTFNKDGKAFQLTCKELGIKHTYKAIAAFLNSEK